ncbi:TolC family protein [Rivibacter subsaxonicus]|uniref:TolC family protein n=1 Tax=Rivibacter subsaxonicus TaxID=457575 RepID=UPI001F5ED431|nr:TolC family protein [Rivibacter subsaxonicus]
MAGGAPARAQAVPLSLDEAVALATGQSARVKATEAQADAARQMAVAAGQRPDPVLKLGINNLPVDGPDRWSLTRDFMTMRSVGLMQELTRADKRRARAARAAGEADAAAVAQRQVTAELQRDAALAWLERSFQQSMRELLVTQRIEAELQLQAAEAAYRGGKGMQADVLAARTEVETMHDRIAQVDRMLAVSTIQLGRWIGDAAARPVAARPAFAPPPWAEGDLAMHLTGHPQIAGATQQVALAQAEASIARAERQADWSVELMYSQRGPAYSNMVSLNLSVPLQWDQKQRQDRELAARQSQVNRAAAELDDLLRAHEAEVRALLQEWQSEAGRLRRHDEKLLPLARQRVEAALSAYRAGSGSLTAVLEARRTEIDTRMERLRIEMEISRRWAQLEFLDLAVPTAASPARHQIADAPRSRP